MYGKKQKILNKVNKLKNPIFNFNIIEKELEKVKEIEEEEEEEEVDSESEDENKEQENDFLNLVDEFENIKKKDIKKFVRENRDEINNLPLNLKNKLLELIKDRLY